MYSQNRHRPVCVAMTFQIKLSVIFYIHIPKTSETKISQVHCSYFVLITKIFLVYLYKFYVKIKEHSKSIRFQRTRHATHALYILVTIYKSISEKRFVNYLSMFYDEADVKVFK